MHKGANKVAVVVGEVAAAGTLGRKRERAVQFAVDVDGGAEILAEPEAPVIRRVGVLGVVDVVERDHLSGLDGVRTVGFAQRIGRPGPERGVLVRRGFNREHAVADLTDNAYIYAE